MIRKIKFNNFYSFDGTQEINFLVKKKKTYDYYKSKSGHQITKIACFIGSNASGKTNVIRLFSFFGYFVSRRSRSIKDENEIISEIAFKNFFNNEKQSDFYIEFEKNDTIFYYSFSIEKNQIIKENLKIKKIEKKSKEIEIFSRDLDGIINLNNDYFKNISKESLPNTRKDVSIITSIKKSIYEVEIISEVYDYFSKFITNINERGYLNTNMPLYQLNQILKCKNDIDLKKNIEEVISGFDLGLKGFDFIEEELFDEKNEENNFEKKNYKRLSIYGIHETKEKNNKIGWIYESRGTRSIFFVLVNILFALKNDIPVIIFDEIETGFHPEALNKLITYYIDLCENKNIQLLFSSHSHEFMNKLDMHQIFLVEKNKGKSFVYPLNKIKNIRSDENFLSKYLSGAYGAFPKIRI